MSEAEAAALRSRASAASSQLSGCRAQSAELEEKIRKLKAAQRQVAPVEQDARMLELETQHPDVCVWEGQRRKKFDGYVMGALSGEIGAFSRGAGRLHDHMGQRIRELEHQLDACQDSMTSLTRILAGIQDAMGRAD